MKAAMYGVCQWVAILYIESMDADDGRDARGTNRGKTMWATFDKKACKLQFRRITLVSYLSHSYIDTTDNLDSSEFEF